MTIGKRVLVVGGGMGIGEHITKFLLQQHHAKVVIFSLYVTEELQKSISANSQIRIVQGDATSEDDRAKAMEAVHSFLGGLDSLICTVGIMGQVQRVAQMSPESIVRTYSVNVFAPISLCQLFLPDLRRSKGKIIILSSAVDRSIKYAGWMQYCSTKAALTRFIEVLGHEESDVKVLGVYPGLTRTTMIDDMVARKYAGIMKDDEIQKFVDWDRNQGMEPPEWCANSVAKMSVGAVEVSTNGVCQYYYEYDPDFKVVGGTSKL